MPSWDASSGALSCRSANGSGTALARALYRRSPILLLDEPASAADQVTSEALQHILERLGPSRTVLMISHDAEVL